MALGPGKYDDLCTYVREKAEAQGAIVIVYGGNRGQGFSCQLPPHVVARVPDVLRQMADQIEADLKKGIL